MSATTDNLRVLIVADDPLVRESLATLLTDQSGLEVVGRFAPERNLSAQIDFYHADVVLWDLGLNPEFSLKRLAELSMVTLPIVVLVPDESHVTEAWTENTRGLLWRETEAESLVAALRAAANDVVVLDPEIAAGLISPRKTRGISHLETLTPRELEVLRLLAEGLPNKAIATRLGVSEHTVKFHINAILSKLNAKSRTDAVVRATRLGLIII